MENTMNMYSPTQKFDLEIEIEYEEVVNLFFFRLSKTKIIVIENNFVLCRVVSTIGIEYYNAIDNV